MWRHHAAHNIEAPSLLLMAQSRHSGRCRDRLQSEQRYQLHEQYVADMCGEIRLRNASDSQMAGMDVDAETTSLLVSRR